MLYYLPKFLHYLCERLHVERAEKMSQNPPVNFLFLNVDKSDYGASKPTKI